MRPYWRPTDGSERDLPRPSREDLHHAEPVGSRIDEDPRVPWDRGSTKTLASLGFPALATRISIGSAIAAAAQAAIVEAGRELLDSGTHTFWTKAIAHMGTVIGAMSAKGKRPNILSALLSGVP